jgi:polysaccharide transporter, PST family
MSLLKTSFYTSISTAITFISGFIVAKVVAVKIGPSGIAMVGQFQNTMSILTMLGSGAINMGVVKYLSETKDPAKRQEIITNVFSLVCLSSLTVSALVLIFAENLSAFAFHTRDYWLVYTFFGGFLVFTAVNTIFGSTFNGLKEIKSLTISNVVFSLTGVAFTVLFAFYFGVKGVLIAVNATALTVFFVNVFLFRKYPFAKLSLRFVRWDKPLLKKLLAFSLMSVISSLVLPLMQLIVRNKIITDFTTTEAGYWQGVTKISDYYLTFITTVLSVYYLPRLSEIHDKAELRNEVFNGYKVILPVVGILALFIWLFRKYVILILFSPEFLPMQPLFSFQLIGDFVKIASWLLGFLMWAKAMVRPFLITELIFSTTFVLWSFLFINRFGIIGATYAFALNYLIYFFTMAVLMRRQLYN